LAIDTERPIEVERPGVEPGRMPIMGHIRELRDRLIKSVIAVVIGVVVGLIFCPQIIEILKAPAGNVELQAITLLENMSVYFKVALVSGVIVAMPYLVYQGFAFAGPGLTPKERGLIYKMLPAVTVMFLAGVAFAYFVALPPALHFMLGFMSNVATITPRITDYIDLVTRLILVVGLVFETPIIVMVMARMGLVSPEWLARRRKMWMVLAFVLAAIITPTFDPINQTIIAVPLILLLELSIVLARFVYKKREKGPTVAT